MFLMPVIRPDAILCCKENRSIDITLEKWQMFRFNECESDLLTTKN